MLLEAIKGGYYLGDPMDAVDALALPVFLISKAIQNMDKVVEIANEIQHAELMAIIFAFLCALFFFVPVAGEIVGEVAELASAARIAELLGTLGDTASKLTPAAPWLIS
jgi:hypothetical protein